MIYNFASRTLSRSLTSLLRQPYGDLVYTSSLTQQVEFPKVPTYRAMDLEGNLLDKTISFDHNYLTKILKTMILVDEMDTILLKVKGQGTPPPTQARSPSI
jgi:hypothetical protein